MIIDKILRRLLPVICIGVLVSLAFSWLSSDWRALDFQRFSFWWLLVAILLALLPWAWHCLRLAIWGAFFGVKISGRNLLRTVVATDVGSVVTPTAVGGAPLKWAMLVRLGYTPGQATTLTLWGNFEDALFYVFAIPVSLALTKNWDNPLWLAVLDFFRKNKPLVLAGVFALVVILLIIHVLIKRKKRKAGWWEILRSALTDCRETFKHIGRRGRKPFVLSMLAMTAQWLTRFCILLAVVKMLGLEADFLKLLMLQWMVFVAILMTPTPGGMGGAEAAFLMVFAGNLPDGSAGMVMAGWRVLTYYFILLFGVGLLALENDNKASITPASSKFSFDASAKNS